MKESAVSVSCPKCKKRIGRPFERSRGPQAFTHYKGPPVQVFRDGVTTTSRPVCARLVIVPGAHVGEVDRVHEVPEDVSYEDFIVSIGDDRLSRLPADVPIVSYSTARDTTQRRSTARLLAVAESGSEEDMDATVKATLHEMVERLKRKR